MYWYPPNSVAEPVQRTGSGSTIDKLNFKNVPQKFTEDTTCTVPGLKIERLAE